VESCGGYLGNFHYHFKPLNNITWNVSLGILANLGSSYKTRSLSQNFQPRSLKAPKNEDNNTTSGALGS